MQGFTSLGVLSHCCIGAFSERSALLLHLQADVAGGDFPGESKWDTLLWGAGLEKHSTRQKLQHLEAINVSAFFSCLHI